MSPISIRTAASSMCAAAGVLCTVGLLASPASAAPTGMSSADVAFLTANQQSNIAEIALGKLGQTKGQDDATQHIGSMTLSDHTKLKAQLSSIATTAKATQPTAPNAMQQAVATQLTNASDPDFDLVYAQAEVTAHKMALSAAKTERDTTSNASLKSYASDYLTVATPHLTMSQDEVDALGGAPSQAPAGSGGAAGTASDSGTDSAQLGWIAGGGVLVVAAGAVLVTRRRTVR